MFKQLYRYIFRWDTLSEKEISKVPQFFVSLSHSSDFKSLIYALGAKQLHNRLYQDSGHGYAYVPEDASLHKMLQWINDQHPYFGELSPALIQAFKVYYFLIEILQAAKNSSEKINPYEYAYRVLLWCGDDIEAALDSLDKASNGQEKWPSLLAYKLPGTYSPPPINLQAWQQLFAEDFKTAKRLFHMTTEIEADLRRPPRNIAEALDSAYARRYTKEALHPQFAAFCIEHFVPELVFELCISDDQDKLHEGLYTIQTYLETHELSDLIDKLPGSNLSFITVLFLLKKLETEKGQLHCLRRFESAVKKIDKDHQFFNLMSALGTGKAQEQFISIFTGERLRASFHTYNMLESKMDYVKPAFMPDFLSKIIGKEKLNALITEERHYERFLDHLKPLQISHVTFLKSLFSEERIRSLTQSHSSLASQLKSLPDECHLSYLKDIIGSKHLQDILSQNYCMLATVLVSIRDTDRMAMLFDILGEAAVQSIIPSYGFVRAKEKIQTLIPSGQRQEFLERLLPAAEKEAREWVMGLRQSILKNQFKLGFMGKGGGGVDIILPDGSTKRVPATVGRQWEHSNNALSCSISFIEARTRMKQCVTESKNDNSLVTWFTRRSGTKKYYEQPEFKVDVEDDNDWTLT